MSLNSQPRDQEPHALLVPLKYLFEWAELNSSEVTLTLRMHSSLTLARSAFSGWCPKLTTHELYCTQPHISKTASCKHQSAAHSTLALKPALRPPWWPPLVWYTDNLTQFSIYDLTHCYLFIVPYGNCRTQQLISIPKADGASSHIRSPMAWAFVCKRQWMVWLL